MRVGVEVGGTFTDLILIEDDGTVVATAKTLSTPTDPSTGVLDALGIVDAAGLDGAPLLHGSTVATNAIIERKGATVGFIVTEGFLDLLELQRQDRERIYDLHYQKPVSLVTPDRTFETPERLAASGDVVHPLDDEAAYSALRQLNDLAVTSVAVCLLHSYVNPTHERRVRDLARQHFPNLHVSLSSDVNAEFREYERASTTTIDAFVKPVVEGYVRRLEERSAKHGVKSVWMMQSNGGLLPASYIREHPARTLFSGPAAGVSGAARIAAESGSDNLITMDMGGTSTDVCLVANGQPAITTDATIDRLPIKLPMLDIVSVGSGGGSIVWLDSGGMLQVGPRSAGASPGPACYGLGGSVPTTTDANVARGLIRPGHFLGGEIQLDADAARTSLAPLAAQLGSAIEQFAEDVYRIAGATMANAIRLVSTERGYDPRDYTLVAYGGAGPMHAASVAGELDISEVLVPPYPGLLSAYGLLVGDFQRDFARTSVAGLDTLRSDQIRANLRQLADEGLTEIARYGLPPDTCELRFALDMRYRGQGFELTVPVSPDELEGESDWLGARFHKLHRARYGHATPGEPLEIVTYRVSVVQVQPKPAHLRAEPENGPPHEELPITIDGQPTICGFYWRPALEPGFQVGGPAIVEEPTATTFVPPGWRLRVDEQTNLRMTAKT